MITLAASAFPWPGKQNPQQGYLLSEHPIEILLLRANDLRFDATRAACGCAKPSTLRQSGE
jgi:hypothetical protein